MTVIETRLVFWQWGTQDSRQRKESQKVIKKTMLHRPTFDEVSIYFTIKQIPTSFKELTNVLPPEQDITAQQVECYFLRIIGEITRLKQDLKQRSRDYIDVQMKVTDRANYSVQAEKLERGEAVPQLYFYEYQKCDAQVCLNKRIDSLVTLIIHKLKIVKKEVLIEKFGNKTNIILMNLRT